MKRRVWVEMVNAYADSLLSENLRVADFQSHAAQSDDLAELFRLTDEIAALLIPVDPEPEFVQKLGGSLAAAAGQAEITVAQPSHKWVWLGALASGTLVSGIGVLALLWMRRSRRSAVAAG
jgi:hypothetical protein